MHFMVLRRFFVFFSVTILLQYSFVSHAQPSQEETVIVISGLTVSPECPGTAHEDEGQDLTPAAGEEESALDAGETQEEGTHTVSYGIFEITGYCDCSICTGANHLTYSETVPKAGHTVAADLQVFPLGSRLQIGDCIYTVEDTGKGLKGKKIDIFYNTHEEALEWGRRSMEVYLVEEKDTLD